MPTIYDVDANAFVTATAEEMKQIEQIKAPAWARFVKTGVFKERPPAQDDWWYMRSASILRKIHLKGPIGVSKLRTLYGGKKNNGVAAEHVYRASGNILRKILQQLEAAGLAKQTTINGRKGRIVTPKGESFMNKVAKGLAAAPAPAKKAKVEEVVEEPEAVEEAPLTEEAQE